MLHYRMHCDYLVYNAQDFESFTIARSSQIAQIISLKSVWTVDYFEICGCGKF